MYSNYRDIERAIANEESFNGNSARGYRTGDGYIVYSYDIEILSINLLTGHIVFNEQKYSSTTSRLQNIIRRVYNV